MFDTVSAVQEDEEIVLVDGCVTFIFQLLLFLVTVTSFILLDASSDETLFI